MKIADIEKTVPLFLAELESQGRANNTLKAYRDTVARLSKFLGDFTEREIDKQCIEDFRGWLLENGCGNNGYLNHAVRLRTFFGWCERNGIETGTPIVKADIPKRVKKHEELLSDSEMIGLKSGKPEAERCRKGTRTKAVMALMYDCGLRVSEVVDLRLTDLFWDKDTLVVRNGKGGKTRIAPFTKDAQETVREYMECKYYKRIEGSGYLFGNITKGGFKPLEYSSLRRAVNHYAEQVTGRKDVHPHLLRHQAASEWVERGCSMRDAQNALGHSSIKTTERVYVEVLHEGKSAQTISKLYRS